MLLLRLKNGVIEELEVLVVTSKLYFRSYQNETNLIERTNKVRLCSIYYSSIS